jgi:HEAT repeat protein
LVDFTILKKIKYAEDMEWEGEKIIHIKQLLCRRILRSGRVDDNAWQMVEELAFHPSWDVREEVSHLLLRLGHQRPEKALSILEKMVNDDPWVLETVALAVGKIGVKDPEASLRILKILSREKSFWVRKNVTSSVLRILSSLSKGDAVKWMERWSFDPNRYTREIAAIVMGSLKEADASQKIKRMLESLCFDHFSEIRRAALTSLVRIYNKGNCGKIYEILYALSKDSYWRVREVVALAIGRIGKTENFNGILEALVYDGVGAVRKAAANSLCRLLAIGNKDSLSTIKRLVKDSPELHPDVLKIIANSIAISGRLPSKLSIELLKELGEDEDWGVRSRVGKSILKIQKRLSLV